MSLNTPLLLGILGCAWACGGKAADAGVLSGATGTGGGSAPRTNGGSPNVAGGAESANAASTFGGAQNLVDTDDLILTQDPPCEAWISEIPRRYTDVYWLADASSSMALDVPDPNGTRWGHVRTLITDFLNALESESGCVDIRPSLFVFPATSNSSGSSAGITSESCISDTDMIPLPSGKWDNAHDHTAWIGHIEAVTPSGASPILDAYTRVVQAIDRNGDANQAVIVLVTDAMPTLDAGCLQPAPSAAGRWAAADVGDDTIAPVAPILKAIQTAQATGIRTLVIGAPGSEGQRGWLSRAAMFGGTASTNCDKIAGGEPFCHLDMSREPHAAPRVMDLLKRITGYQSCQFPLVTQAPNVTNPIDSDRLTLFIQSGDGSLEMVTRVSELAVDCQDGFRLLGATTGELCAAPCARLKQDCSAQLQLAYGCRVPKIEAAR